VAAKRKRVRLKMYDDNSVPEEAPGSVLQSVYNFRFKLNDELLGRICVFLEEGLPVVTACELVGITKQTHMRWLNQGLQYITALEEENDPPRKDWRIYAIYLIEIRKSIAAYLRTKIENVNGAFTPSWVRDITILERRDYQNWGRNVIITERDEAKNPDESFL